MVRQRFDRRFFLKATGLGMIALGTSSPPMFLQRLVAAANAESIPTRRKTLVTIFQRGAMDGLMAVSPLDDTDLRRARPRLAMSARSGEAGQRLIELDGGYGLHPALSSMLPLYGDRQLAIVHGIGSPNPTRSHFDAQDFMETGTPFRKGTSSGWLNRALDQCDGEGPFRAISVTATLPRSLYGDEPALAVENFEKFTLRGDPTKTLKTPSAQGFESLYLQTSQDLLRGTGQESFEAIHTLGELNASGYRPAAGANYPNSPLGRSLRQIAFLIKSQVGLQIAFAETGGWDTHVQQGTVNGAFANRARDLSGAIAAFWTDLGEARDDVVLMTMTEFGRTVRENGSGGTDHGRGSCSFVLGTDVVGGEVYGTIPALVERDLEDGRDLPVTIDFRSVFAEVAAKHLGANDDAALFPGWDGTRYRLMG